MMDLTSVNLHASQKPSITCDESDISSDSDNLISRLDKNVHLVSGVNYHPEESKHEPTTEVLGRGSHKARLQLPSMTRLASQASSGAQTSKRRHRIRDPNSTPSGRQLKKLSSQEYQVHGNLSRTKVRHRVDEKDFMANSFLPNLNQETSSEQGEGADSALSSTGSSSRSPSRESNAIFH